MTPNPAVTCHCYSHLRLAKLLHAVSCLILHCLTLNSVFSLIPQLLLSMLSNKHYDLLSCRLLVRRRLSEALITICRGLTREGSRSVL